VFDVTRVATFEAVQKWKNDIDSKVTLPPDDRPIPVVLLANKCDLNPKDGLGRNKVSKQKRKTKRKQKENLTLIVIDF
jgi:hypothetical protein